MARVKRPDMPPPPPKQPRECKHGCTDCVHYRLDVKAFPCRDCERWNYWEDAHPEKTNTFPFPPASIPHAAIQDLTPASTEPETSEPKKRGRRTQIAVSPIDTPPIDSEQAPATPKKRGRKPKAAAVVSEPLESAPVQPITEPAKRARKSSKKADDTSEPALPAKEQLSLF